MILLRTPPQTPPAHTYTITTHTHTHTNHSHSRNQLKGMLEMYAKMKESDFGQEETNIMAGVVDFSHKTVGECMTNLTEVLVLLFVINIIIMILS